MKTQMKPGNVGATIKRTFSYFGKYKAAFALVIVLIIATAAAGIIGTYMLTPLVDEQIMPLAKQASTQREELKSEYKANGLDIDDPAVKKEIESKIVLDYSGLVRIILTIAIAYAIGAVSNYAYARIMVNISTGILNQLRKDMFDHTQSLPISYFDARTHGEIMSSYTNDTDAMREMISEGVPQIVNSVIRVVGVFGMMLVLSPMLTLLTVIMLVFMILIVKAVANKSGRYFKARQADLARVNGYMEEMIEGQKVVKVFCHEDETGKRFEEVNGDLFKSASQASAWANSLMPMMSNLSYAHFALTAIFGVIMVAFSGSIFSFAPLTIGMLTSFLQYTRNFSNPITQLSQIFNGVMSALAGAERIYAIIDSKPEVDEGKVTLTRVERDKNGNLAESKNRTGLWAWKRGDELTELKGEVIFKDVTFSYDGKVDVLKNISLYAKPGQKIAFVGSTGAGKTTITNLINRFYDIQSGTITYDGIPIKEIEKASLRRSLAMVLQDTHLFTGTVMENIRYGRLDATDDEVIAAAKLANAHFFISHLPQGYQTMLTADGANLSQGQRQLLAIARVAVADPPVLILDEATSSIDTRTEALIENGMDELMRGRTVFIIAHRLSTVRNSNAIMVLEKGEIIERGDHDELIKKKGRYYDLYTGAFELE